MSTTFAGYSLLWTLEPEGGLEVLWARGASSPAYPARLTRTPLDLAPESVEALHDGWRIGTYLEHPGLLRAFDHGLEGTQAWVAHEVVDGVTLAQMLDTLAQTGHVIPADVVLAIAGQVCATLSYVHAASGPDGRQLMLTHGGLCPENIWLLRDGTIKLDGLRRSDDPRPFPGDPAYLAPELGAGDRPDTRSDLYALGVLTAHLLLGRCPDVTQPDAVARELAQRKDAPEAVPRLVAELCAPDRDARPQLARMLTQRFDNLEALVAEPIGLARYVAGGVNHLSPPSPEHAPTALLTEVHNACLPYPPTAQPDMAITALAPSGYDGLSAPASPEDADGPRLSLPRPTAAGPLTLPAPAPDTPKLLDFADGAPPPTEKKAKRWKAGANTAGMPTWLMVAMAVLSVVGAVALTRFLLPGEEEDLRARAHSSGGMKGLARGNRGTLGSLEVTSDPPGATIYVNKKRQDGVTPFEPPNLGPGAKVEVFVSKAGFADTSPRTVHLDKFGKDKRKVHFRLRPLHRYQIKSDPPGATVEISGRSTKETTPFWLESVIRGESVSLDFTKRGYMPGVANFVAGTRTPTITEVKLEPARLFNITSTPAGIRVRIDGETIGRTPIEEYAIPRGKRFELELRRPDIRPYKKTITANGRLVRTLNIKLRKLPMSKLALTPGERGALARLSQEMKEAQATLSRARRQRTLARQRVRTFETMNDIRVTELEEAQAALDDAEAEIVTGKANVETKQIALDELRLEIAERLEMIDP